MAVVTAADAIRDREEFFASVEPLRDARIPAFLDHLKRRGVRAAARRIGVNELSVHKRRWEDADFGAAVQRILDDPMCRRRAVSDDLFAAIDAIRKLVPCDYEGALDELINVMSGSCEAPSYGLSPADREQLTIARYRLADAAHTWANMILHPDVFALAPVPAVTEGS